MDVLSEIVFNIVDVIIISTFTFLLGWATPKVRDNRKEEE